MSTPPYALSEASTPMLAHGQRRPDGSRMSQEDSIADRAGRRSAGDVDAWVAILTGAGRAFCAGADVREGGSAGTFAGTFWEKPTINSFESGLELFKPTIAAINGPCLGYGVTAVSFCDFVLASERATFGFPEVRIGVPTIVGAIRMPQRLAWADAMELLLVGEAVDATRAKEMGLVWKVVPHDELLAEARRLATRLCQSAPRVIERRVVDGAGLTASATDEHRAHTCRGIAYRTAPAFGGLVVGVGMNSKQAMRTRSGVASHSEHLGLRGDVAHSQARDGIVQAFQRRMFPPEKHMQSAPSGYARPAC